MQPFRPFSGQGHRLVEADKDLRAAAGFLFFFFWDLMGNSKKEPLKMVILCDFHGDSNGLIWENQLLLFFGLNRDDHGMIGEYCTRIMEIPPGNW